MGNILFPFLAFTVKNETPPMKDTDIKTMMRKRLATINSEENKKAKTAAYK